VQGDLVAEETLYFDDVNEGDAAPEVSHELTRTDLVMYAGASGDFNPMHHDEIKAQAAGLPSVFGHGMFSMGLLGRAITDWVGIGNLRTFKVRFTKQTWPGETLVSTITVTGKRKADDAGDGENLVDLEISLANGDGEVKVAGEASAALPSR
jgi:acyl dehydratase